MASAQKHISDYRLRQQTLQEQDKELGDSKNQIQHRLTNEYQQIDDLESDLEDHSIDAQHRKNLELEWMQANERVDKLEARLQSVQDHSKTVHAIIESQGTIIDLFQRDLDERDQAMKALEEAFKNKLQEVESARASVLRQAAEIERQIRAQRKVLGEKLQEKIHQARELQSQSRKKTEELEQLQNQVDVAEQKIRDLEAQLQDQNQNTEERRALERALDLARLEAQTIRADLKATQEQTAHLQRDLLSGKISIRHFQRDLKTQQKTTMQRRNHYNEKLMKHLLTLEDQGTRRKKLEDDLREPDRNDRVSKFLEKHDSSRPASLQQWRRLKQLAQGRIQQMESDIRAEQQRINDIKMERPRVEQELQTELRDGQNLETELIHQRVVNEMVDSAYYGRLSDLKRYIEKEHVDVNAHNSRGVTALVAAANDHQEVVAYLLSCEEIDVNVPNAYGDTPMHVMVYNHGPLIVHHYMKMLLDDGRVDLTLRNNKGKTVFELAAQRKSEKCIALIRVPF